MEKTDNRCQHWNDIDTGIIWQGFYSNNHKNTSVNNYEHVWNKRESVRKETEDIKNQMENF